MNDSTKEDLRPLQMVAVSFILSPAIYTILLILLNQNSGGVDSANPEVASIFMKVCPFLSLGCVAMAAFIDRLAAKNAEVPQWQRYKNNLIVKLACYSSIAIFGLMLGFLGAELQVSLAYFVVAIFFMLRIFPTEKSARSTPTF